MKKLFLFIITFLTLSDVFGQLDKYNQIDLHPVSPTAFQFLKYTEMPLSEYTGIPNISIPLYNIEVDEVSIPLELSYHSQGIRVSQEAGWTGLGWDLQLGSIVQEINDRDDFGTDIWGNNIKRRPDYFYSSGDGSPTVLPMYLRDPHPSAHGNGWMNPYPVSHPAEPPVQPQQGFAIATKYYIPVNGEFGQPETNMMTERWYDSEPDIFTASFMGETLKFIIDFNSTQTPVVLDKKGYKVTKTADGFKIVNPEGSQYFFEIKTSIKNSSVSEDFEGTSGSSDASGSDVVSHIYLLSRIITVNGKLISFDYYQTGEFAGYTNVSMKLQILTDLLPFNRADYPHGGGDYMIADFDARSQAGHFGQATYNTTSVNKESYFYLKSITFPNGKADFQVSDRTDITGAKRLDKLIVKNSKGSLVSSWSLGYSYFDATAVGGNGYNNSTLGAETRSALRLKLTSLTNMAGGIHNFTYNSTPLPKKNSYAQDYWGFYNGQLSNTSLAPNPAALGLPDLGNNGNNRDASLTYAKAGILEGIQYPTGGKVMFEYALNEFDKGQMRGMPGASPSTVAGSGLRIAAVYHYTGDNALSGKTIYSYEGGLLIIPVDLVRETNYTKLNEITINHSGSTSYKLTEISANGVFSSNPLSPLNGVGYSKVTKQEVGANNNNNGKTVTEFYNNIAIHNPTIASRVRSCSVPALQSVSAPENGVVKTVSVFDNNNKLLRITDNTYTLSFSPVTYGARVMSFSALYYAFTLDGAVSEVIMIPRNVIGYYPVYGMQSRLTGTTTRAYDENNTILVTTAVNTYDEFGQLIGEQARTSAGQYEETRYSYAYNNFSLAPNLALYSANRLTELTGVIIDKRAPDYAPIPGSSDLQKEYAILGDKVVVSKVIINRQSVPDALPSVTTFNQYDPLNGNLLEYTEKNSTKSFMWDYAGEYVAAEVVNAAYSSIGYTSFEAESKGGFIFTGTILADPSAPTGNQVYELGSGTITRSGLDPAKLYTISYWSKNGPQTVNATAPVSGRSCDGWTFYQHTGVVPSGGAITISGSGTIDELRLHPQGAIMTTYTYDPLIGMTSQCDANNRIVYYEYDSQNRLALMRDQDKNVLKRVCYNYAGQAESCNYYTSTAKSGNFMRANCHNGYIGSTVTYVVPAGKYTSTISQADADQKAQDDLDNNGQAYASQTGVCTQPPCSPSNCSGPQMKCVNGVCETGTRVNKSTVRIKVDGIWKWQCTWNYCFSDGSTSDDFTEYNDTACSITSSCLL
jgi:hypothetical protein